MSYEEEDTCHMTLALSPTVAPVWFRVQGLGFRVRFYGSGFRV